MPAAMKQPLRGASAIVPALLVLCCARGPAPWTGDDKAGQAWLRPPSGPDRDTGWTTFPGADAYEVVASKELTAVLMLETKPFVALSQEWASTFTSGHYRSASGKVPYLVRAVCGHGATGAYSLHRRGKELHIAHGSLGRSTVYHRSA